MALTLNKVGKTAARFKRNLSKKFKRVAVLPFVALASYHIKPTSPPGTHNKPS